MTFQDQKISKKAARLLLVVAFGITADKTKGEHIMLYLPTQTSVQRYLREFHNKVINVLSMYEGDFGYSISVKFSYDEKITELKDFTNHAHLAKKNNIGTFEEALEEGIIYCLTQIIVENEKV